MDIIDAAAKQIKMVQVQKVTSGLLSARAARMAIPKMATTPTVTPMATFAPVDSKPKERRNNLVFH
jgi:hypothetical protein